LKEPKPPIYRDGELVCPHCKTPLLTEEGVDGKFYCAFCKKEVGRLTDETMRRMADDFPANLLKEWMIETTSSH
jgi:uncharacterized Zn finger protein (UPF0148 family)